MEKIQILEILLEHKMCCMMNVATHTTFHPLTNLTTHTNSFSFSTATSILSKATVFTLSIFLNLTINKEPTLF